ncbi:MAG: hypothetical protein JWN29_3639 [Acidimicrobiales bacterium]|jgi:DNA-directed RNA polymerase specialized sigma24 family protein|nr:hypothetical protein [Acidimicrobiales bacterium]
MDDEEALDALPRAYAVALRMDAGGEGTDAIAAALGLDLQSIPALLEIGRRKLRSLLDDG